MTQRQRPTLTATTHVCPAKGCTRRVVHAELACPTHWRKLPWRMRTNLNHAWRNGDLAGHAEALDAALDWYRTHDLDPATARTDYGLEPSAPFDTAAFGAEG